MSSSHIQALPITKYFYRKVIKAMEHPYNWSDIEEMLKKEKFLSAQYVSEKIKKKDFEKGLERLHAETPALIAKTLPELEAILEILEFSDEMKASTLADSKIKYDCAVSKGYLCRFSVWIYKTNQGGLYIYCAPQIKI